MMQVVPPRRVASYAARIVSGHADGLERVVEAVAAGDRLLGRPRSSGLTRVGGAEPLGVLELVVDEVDRHDLGRTGHPGALDGGDAHAAAAEHDDRRAGRRPWRC